MKRNNHFSRISIDHGSAIPKYLQLAEQIIAGVREQRFAPGMVMPSINEVSDNTDLSRPTAQKAYKHLQKIKVLDSVPGKCYFVTGEHPKSSLYIALYFNKLSAHKKIIYDAFVKEMGEEVQVDFFIYNNEFKTFKIDMTIVRPQNEI
ncbi:MAG: GntR family transcriptional regulator [Chitinophagaceae bacterium]|nr:MAG: GntR family transcriptional regulator [Chitinophagaceae bacterium]